MRDAETCKDCGIEQVKESQPNKRTEEMNQQKMAWKTIRMNERFGLQKNRLSQSKIDRFLETQNPNQRIRNFVLNLHLSEEKLAKRTGTELGATRRFLPWVVQSVLDNQSRVGKPLTNPDLIRYRNRQTAKTFATSNGGKYVSDGKKIIHNRLKELVQDDASPKEGVVLTLAYMFSLEKELIKLPALRNLFFHSCEYPYQKKNKITKYNRVYRKQIRMLMRNKKLGERCLALFSNINDVLQHESEDRFAHLFLDYCGSVTTNGKVVDMVMQKNLVKLGGIIWVTLCSRSCKGDRVTKILPEIAKKHQNNYRVEQVIPTNGLNRDNRLFAYQSKMDKRKKRGKTMFTMMFRRIK